MADTITLNSESGGATLATDDIGGVHYQRVKIGQGADGSATDVSSAAPLQVSLANTAANATAVKVDGSAVTQPVSLTSTTVTGSVAVTNAGLTELEAAINASSQMDVNVAAGTLAVTNAGLTELAGAINASAQMDVNLAASAATVTVTGTVTANLGATDNAVIDSIDASTSRLLSSAEGVSPGTVGATTVLLTGGIYNSTPPTFTNTQRGAVQLDANGYVKVNVAAGAATGYTEADTDASITGTAIMWEDTADTIRAVSAAKPLPVNVVAGSAANAAASATASAVPASADYQGLNVSGTLRGATGLGVGSHYAGTVAVVDASGNQITSFGGSAGVVSALHLVAAATANAQNVKASAGTFRGFSMFNNAAYPIYLKLHNTAGTPTAGASVVRTFGIQAGTLADVTMPGGGVSFATGIGLTLVKDLADAGTTATAASDAVGEIYYE